MNNKKLEEKVREIVLEATETAVSSIMSLVLTEMKSLVDFASTDEKPSEEKVLTTADVDPSEIKGTLTDVTPVYPEEETPSTELYAGYTIDQLKAMKYNEFKKVAATIGVKCTGTRDEIMERILSTKAPEKKEEEPVLPSEPSTEVIDEFAEAAKSLVATSDIDELIEALDEAGIKATKKNVETKLAEALRKGEIELEDDEDDEDDEVEEEAEVEEVDEEEDDGEEITAETYFEEYDMQNLNNPDDMTKARKKSTVEVQGNAIKAYENGMLSVDSMKDFIKKYTTQEEFDNTDFDSAEPDEIFGAYVEVLKSLVDNDGEVHTNNEPYECGEHDCCCGHVLKYVKKSNSYICEVCGEEYEE